MRGFFLIMDNKNNTVQKPQYVLNYLHIIGCMLQSKKYVMDIYIMVKKKYKCIFFDLHFTLIAPKVSEVDFIYEMAVEMGLLFSKKTIAKALDESWKHTDASIHETLTDEERYKQYWISKNIEVLKKIDSDLPDSLCLRFGEKLNYSFANDATKFRVLEHVYTTLKKLKKQNYRIVLVTNALSGVRNIITSLKLGQYFDDIIISTEEGYSKPNPSIFSRVFSKYNLQPIDCLIVGDSYGSDILAGKNCGMDTCLLRKEYQSSLVTTKDHPTYVVDSLSTFIGTIC